MGFGLRLPGGWLLLVVVHLWVWVCVASLLGFGAGVGFGFVVLRGWWAIAFLASGLGLLLIVVSGGLDFAGVWVVL